VDVNDLYKVDLGGCEMDKKYGGCVQSLMEPKKEMTVALIFRFSRAKRMPRQTSVVIQRRWTEENGDNNKF
jgi:hypothetical protein